MLKNKSIIFCLLLVMLAMTITACSKGDQSSESKKSNGETKKETVVSEQPKTRTVKTVNGDIEIPANPKRIVVGDYLPTLLVLGEKPVGAGEQDLANVHIQDQITGIESTGESSMEKILELQPDLIISADSEPSTFDKLSKIAPTVIIPYSTYSDTYEEVRAIGEMLGKDKEAENGWLLLMKKYNNRERKFRR
ncbi:ABC transporter substrate-binding protein [Paenibacillus glacialis]|uniref:ABC transporter substrate-binding protein n=1 Tax=Paenibacillus glacialis TaxID=494026 RepID=UPI000AC47B88|nr:ABC transporter substrate-binding protein [Paenibacillus glacialis]